MKPEELILKLDEDISTLYQITNEIKYLDLVIASKSEPQFESANKSTMIMLLIRYSDVSVATRARLEEYFKMEKEQGLPVNLNFHRLYNKLND